MSLICFALKVFVLKPFLKYFAPCVITSISINSTSWRLPYTIVWYTNKQSNIDQVNGQTIRQYWLVLMVIRYKIITIIDIIWWVLPVK